MIETDQPGDASAAPHIPVMLAEAIAALNVQPGGAYLDGTFGAGGYTRAILQAAPGTRVLALDRDPAAIRDGAGLVAEMAGRLTLAQTPFGDLDEVADRLGFAPLDGVVLDIGVSSMQFDQAERGFSFRFDGPLDMRMDGEGATAADIVNSYGEEELASLIWFYGEERQSRRIARAIVHDREAEPFVSTRQLAGLLGRLIPSRPTDIHPATRTFQALRIAVNDELGELARALHAAERALKPGGRLVVVSFHSLEDRIVKRFLADRAGKGAAMSRHLPGEATEASTGFRLIGPQPREASPDERDANPRARSAKLRVAERTEAPAQPRSAAIMALTAPPRAAATTRRRRL